MSKKASPLDANSKVSRALREIRRARGITQEEFGEVSSRVHVSRIERGLKQPTLPKVDSFAGVLGVHPLTLMALSYVDLMDEDGLDRLLMHVAAECEELRKP